MSRFADPSATDVLVLPGGCQCPGSPHDADEWVYRTELGDSEQKRAALAGFDLATSKGEKQNWLNRIENEHRPFCMVAVYYLDKKIRQYQN